MPQLRRDPKPDFENGPVVIHPIQVIATILFVFGAFANGTASNYLFLAAFSAMILDMQLRHPRFVFPRKQEAVDRPHP